MIVKSNRRTAPTGRRMGGVRPITASQNITSGVRNRKAQTKVQASYAGLDPSKRAFARQLQATMRRKSAITAATNTSNIMAKPDFLELLPLFVQKLLILDVFGSVAMKSRQQLVPYFKFVAENDKGMTHAGDVLSSPFANRQGVDPDFGGRAVKGELLDITNSVSTLVYGPVLPGSVTLRVTKKSTGEEITVVDPINKAGELYDATDATFATKLGKIDYDTNEITLDQKESYSEVVATYQYDNETVGHNQETYGAAMGKGYLTLDEFNLVAEAHELACYWSIYSAFAAATEYGANIGDIAKEAAFAELTAEINTQGFKELETAAQFAPQFNWDAAPVLAGSVVPSDYLNMFKLKLGQAAASIYQKTRLTQPNRLSVGTTTAEYIKMINGFQADAVEDSVGPYKLGRLDQFDVYVCPEYDPNKWVMSCKSNDIRRNSALFGEYMPLTDTDPITLANASAQQGYATMYAMKVVNPDTVVSGKIVGGF